MYYILWVLCILFYVLFLNILFYVLYFVGFMYIKYFMYYILCIIFYESYVFYFMFFYIFCEYSMIPCLKYLLSLEVMLWLMFWAAILQWVSSNTNGAITFLLRVQLSGTMNPHTSTLLWVK